MTYSIQILDNHGNLIGELMTASLSDVMKFINKGLTVVNKLTGQPISTETVNQTIGVSDGLIDIG